MKVFAVIAMALLPLALGDAPPIPYAGSQSTSSFSADRVHAVADPYEDHFDADGFNVQSGYEGYLIPAGEHGVLSLADGLNLKAHRGFLHKLAKCLISLGWKVVPKVAIGAAAILVLFLVGGCVNAFVCTFTPFCAVSFDGAGVTKDSMRSYLTPDRISSTATFVLDAIKKYKDMYDMTPSAEAKQNREKE